MMSTRMLLVIVIFALLLMGCTRQVTNRSLNDPTEQMENITIQVEKENTDMSEISCVSTDFCGIQWENIEFPVNLEKLGVDNKNFIISNQESAIEIGQTLIDEIKQNEKMENYVLLAIVHSTQDNIWRFEYAENCSNNVDELIDGSVFNIAINGTVGNVIMAWLEE